MKIGIYGGSFNPPHNMHLKFATSLINRKYLDKIIFVPTGNYYPKPNLASNKERLEMVKLMIEDYDCLDVSDFEMKNTLIYTYQTLDYFKDIYSNDEIYFILGSDLLKSLESWNNYNYILENFKLLVTLRNSDKKEDLEKLELSNKHNIIYTNLNLQKLSSTEIRKSIKKNDKLFLEKNLNKKIIKYIEEKNLYKEGELC